MCGTESEVQTAQSALHRFSERIELVDLHTDETTPGQCPDCGGDISGPQTAVPLPDDVHGEYTRGWHCEECRVSVVNTPGGHEQRRGGWTGWEVVDVVFRDGEPRPIAIPEGGRIA